MAAAILHDVLEDTTTTEADIHNFLLTLMPLHAVNKTLQLVEELTDIYTREHYPQWNRSKRRSMEAERLARISGEAQTIKYADILDNSREIIPHDPDFAFRFLKECRNILLLMQKGDPTLRKKAFEVVNNGLQELDTRKRK